MMRSDLDVFIQNFLRALAIAVIIFVTDGVGLLNPVKYVLERQIIGLAKVQSPLINLIKTPAQITAHYRTGSKRILDLENRLAASIVDQSKLRDLEQENIALRKLLESPLPPDWDYITAPVIGQNNQELILGVGLKQGVVKGSSVIYEEVLIGTVAQVSQTLTTVETIYHPNQRIAVNLVGTSYDGLAISQDNQLQLTQVLQNVDLNQGDIIVTSGIDGIRPKLVVGTVAELLQDDQGLYKQAKLQNPLSLENLTTVFIVKPN